ncbi:DEAD/DEAH box helicase [Enterococcus avium]|uniref:DEAD/DEAH box helicase n=1 Tax=Enterococcus avium TaxID=33945 RepID=A0ABD5F7E9_ENTAV|nr:DEAD/DEAH box helicase [Enterococcus avium]MDT2397774.1 DEAD/DEAH box helicase [Enterococcus avium]MDT2448619.1 DEAD/DEAH box helicase [Enterococcus avium]MDT2514368.1 DEAD/DEAH box helicase [Enterococcus avium]MDY6440757.1 DEAD/DEAH box helicase [Enterococcus avium]MDY6446509.1 DEAD/DEAH box helicase [Enterococcus avium]
MMTNDGKRTLTRIKNQDNIRNPIVELLYKKIEITNKDAEFLYSVALLLIDEYSKEIEKGIDKNLLIEYAYFIIATTAFKVSDFRALYDFSINYGYYPIARKIIDLDLLSDMNINHVMTNSRIDKFEDGDKILTYQQKKVFEEVLDDKGNAVSFLAPTSYGKSELIFDHLSKNEDKNYIGIVVPTKALIDQVYREAKKKVKDRKLIIHDQNYSKSEDKRILTITTQERALRLVDEGVKFDILYIDEAHEMLNFDYRNNLNNRSLLLTRLIKLSRAANQNLLELYLSPVIGKASNLEIRNSKTISDHRISKDLKILNISFLNSEGNLKYYDRYLGEFIDSEKMIRSHFDYIIEQSKNKNLHFLYRPRYIEGYAKLLYEKLPFIEEYEIDSDIKKLISELAEIVHPKFKLIKYLSKGLVYLHGKMPLIIRNYVLKYVRESRFLSHFVANSVILAGMNLPIDNLFYISGYSNSRDLYNLIGRVNRLSDIFSKENPSLNRIFIPVHFIEMDRFPQNQQGSLAKKIEKLRGRIKDEIKNPLLENSTIATTNSLKAEEIIETEDNIVNSYLTPDFKSRLTRSGAQQLLNYTEQGLQKLSQRFEENQNYIQDDEILIKVKELFFDNFEDFDFSPNYSVDRLKNIATINYYKNFIYNLNTKSLHERINNLVFFWKSKTDSDYQIYVGTQFGEVTRKTENYIGQNLVYVDLSDHINDEDYLYNLAIIKLQVDEDYVSYEITLLLNTLLEFDIINQKQFDRFIYGTDSNEEIKILRLGISRGIYRKLKQDDMIKNIHFDDYGNVKANSLLISYVNEQLGIVKFELEQIFL